MEPFLVWGSIFCFGVAIIFIAVVLHYLTKNKSDK